MEWTPDLLVGVRELDQQHEELVRRLDGLYAALKRNDPAELSRAFTSLADYSVFHFHDEEREMVRSDFPGYLMHRAVHQGFVDELNAWAARFEQGASADLGGALQAWLDSWMHTHLSTLDRALGDHLAKRGAEGQGTRR